MINFLTRIRNGLMRRMGRLPSWLAAPVRKIIFVCGNISHKLFVQKRLLTFGGWAALFSRSWERLFTNLKRIVSSLMTSAIKFLVYKCVVPLSRWLTSRRLKKGRARTLWGCTPILTLPLKVRADKALGFRSHSLVFATYYISKQFDINLQKLTNGVYKYLPYIGFPFDKLMLSYFMLRYDVFHFFYDRSILRPTQRFGINIEELELLRAAGKRVYAYAYGADVRQRQKTLALGKWNFCTECPDPMKFCVCDDTIGNKTMAQMCALVTKPLALGDMLAYVPGARNMHYWPIDLDMVPLAAAPRITGPLKIAHAPNHMHFKGSHYLEATIEKLRLQGHAIDYVKVQGVPNSEVIRLFGEADLIADQFIGGAYGYTALEAMARGKPVMTYVRSPDLVEAVAECPLINVTPDTLEEILLWLLGNRETLPAIGAQGRYYVEAWHSIEAVAERLGHLYEDTAEFPPATLSPILAQREAQTLHRQKLVPAKGWAHPFLIGSKHLDEMAT